MSPKELKRLQKEIAKLREENEILKKAIALLAKK
jgi:transposase-like protein